MTRCAEEELTQLDDRPLNLACTRVCQCYGVDRFNRGAGSIICHKSFRGLRSFRPTSIRFQLEVARFDLDAGDSGMGA